ncbi:hypothetical protein MMC06_004033, partial [Schaereria dolodes]|nr:hypothetical protein [Schaereria dolodes]
MPFLLDRGAELQQRVRDGLARRFEDVDERAGEGFVVLGEERDGEAGGGGAGGSVKGENDGEWL